jgi:hypothetical protein
MTEAVIAGFRVPSNMSGARGFGYALPGVISLSKDT